MSMESARQTVVSWTDDKLWAETDKLDKLDTLTNDEFDLSRAIAREQKSRRAATEPRQYWLATTYSGKYAHLISEARDEVLCGYSGNLGVHALVPGFYPGGSPCPRCLKAWQAEN